ncbi:uncharacterized protein LOC130939806 [Arachis stenosperma]|uniref:uncharacterized protein LOC130939806 n=1 Tax=Arachis stenosperma TaxID=217475 RepID=UPI0025ABD80D|nr:uncharacterized protein LOC130939806 [Arachis stenosperma]
MCGVSDKAFRMIQELLGDAFEHAKILASLNDAKRIIRKLSNAYKKIDACPNDCMLYQGSDQELSRINVVVKKNRKPQAAKVLRYFPLIPRLQRMFMSSKTSVDMLWHKKGPNLDSFLRHQRDGEAWKVFDRRYTVFSSDPRSVCLALASDGFNPFGNLSSRYSIWPVILIPYNLPPWICMKPSSFLLSMIIPGPKMSGNDIDVYLQPLIDELKQLWGGVETYDASEKKTFKIYAALMWTINNFLGLDHRRFLSPGHRYQQDRVRFDGKVKDRSPPIKLSGGDNLRQLENVHVTLGKVQMVTEKNVYDNMIYTILNDSGKSNDHLKVRKDLQLTRIRHDLWPRVDEKYLTAIFSMLNSQKDVFFKTLKNVVFPDGHSSNISRCVDLHQQKLSGLKSHDNHTLKDYLLPIASRNVLPAPVSVVLADFSTFFRRLCSKSIDPQQLPLLQEHVVLTLCRMEIIFPPSFFTVMVHLTLHLVEEYVRNTAAPEGSIAEGYLSDEILTFCSRYLDNVESKINIPVHVDDRLSKDVTKNVTSMFPLIGKVVGAAAFFNLSPIERLQAHRHIPLGSTIHSRESQWLVCDPNIQARRFKTYASARDNNVVVGGVSYYGRLVDIIELNYSGQFTVALFRCLWVDTTSDDEPYILASEVRLVYYVDDEVDEDWSVVVHAKPRDLFDMGKYNEHCLSLTRDGNLEESLTDAINTGEEAADL